MNIDTLKVQFTSDELLSQNLKLSVVRKLEEIEEIFQSKVPFNDKQNIIYKVFEFDIERNINNLLCGVCILYPGKVGNEFYMTKGHTHLEPRSELYIGVSGQGILLMQNEKNGECIYEEILEHKLIYVPEGYSHRHINTGNEPLITYYAVAADAGHDYNYVIKNPFSKTVQNINTNEYSVQELF